MIPLHSPAQYFSSFFYARISLRQMYQPFHMTLLCVSARNPYDSIRIWQNTPSLFQPDCAGRKELYPSVHIKVLYSSSLSVSGRKSVGYIPYYFLIFLNNMSATTFLYNMSATTFLYNNIFSQYCFWLFIHTFHPVSPSVTSHLSVQRNTYLTFERRDRSVTTNIFLSDRRYHPVIY